MRLGVGTTVNDKSLPVTEVATALEDHGIESMWVGEHTHMPVDTVHNYSRGGNLHDIYKRFPDPFVTLTAAAAVTTNLRLGTSICLLAEHNPLILAKTIATVDQISRGRVELGLGYGWNEPEVRNNGVDFGRRRDVFREKLQAIKLLWTQETVAFDGEFIKFSESWSWPKPIQEPNPPLLIGAAPGRSTFSDIVRLADGWFPEHTMVGDSLPQHVATLRRHAEDAGRDPDTLSITVCGITGMTGRKGADAIRERLPQPEVVEQLAAVGVDRITARIPVNDRDLMLPVLEVLADYRRYLPE